MHKKLVSLDCSISNPTGTAKVVSFVDIPIHGTVHHLKSITIEEALKHLHNRPRQFADPKDEIEDIKEKIQTEAEGKIREHSDSVNTFLLRVKENVRLIRDELKSTIPRKSYVEEKVARTSMMGTMLINLHFREKGSYLIPSKRKMGSLTDWLLFSEAARKSIGEVLSRFNDGWSKIEGLIHPISEVNRDLITILSNYELPRMSAKSAASENFLNLLTRYDRALERIHNLCTDYLEAESEDVIDEIVAELDWIYERIPDLVSDIVSDSKGALYADYNVEMWEDIKYTTLTFGKKESVDAYLEDLAAKIKKSKGLIGEYKLEKDKLEQLFVHATDEKDRKALKGRIKEINGKIETQNKALFAFEQYFWEVYGKCAGESGSADHSGDSIVLVKEKFTPADWTMVQRYKAAGKKVGIVTMQNNANDHFSCFVNGDGSIAYVKVADRSTFDALTGATRALIEGNDLVFGDREIAKQLQRELRQLRSEPVKPEDKKTQRTAPASLRLMSSDSVGPSGIGLYRTEKFYMSDVLPHSEILYRQLRQQARYLNGQPFVVRVFDFSNEKLDDIFCVSKPSKQMIQDKGIVGYYLDDTIQDLDGNPFSQLIDVLIRLSAHYKGIVIEIPMVKSYRQLKEVIGFINSRKAAYEKEHKGRKADFRIGMMIETRDLVKTKPTRAGEDVAAYELKRIFEERDTLGIDVFSIGINDFSSSLLWDNQQMINRAGTKPFDYKFHPYVLRKLKVVADMASEHGVELNICGEIMDDVDASPYLESENLFIKLLYRYFGIKVLTINSKDEQAIVETISGTKPLSEQQKASLAKLINACDGKTGRDITIPALPGSVNELVNETLKIIQ